MKNAILILIGIALNLSVNLDSIIILTILIILIDFILFYLFYFIYFILFYFIFGCIGSLLLCASFLYLQRMGTTLHCGAQPSHCGGFSCCLLWSTGSRHASFGSCGSQALEHRFSCCGAWA